MTLTDTAYSKEIYIKNVLHQLPRIFTCLDQNPCSKTFGCFDRDYWHYKIASTPSARKQEAMLTLALLYLTPTDKNPHYQKEYMISFVESAIEYLLGIQERNGSFSEWYAHENSFVATSFTLYALTETILLLGDRVTEHVRRKAEICIHRAAMYLSDKYEYQAQNQESGSILALYNSYLVTKNNTFKDVASKKLHILADLQKSEGWFLEYGGPDIGYLSLTIDHLTAYYEKSQEIKALEMSKKACEFLKVFIHPDFTAGGTYASRNTQYLIPSGIERLSCVDPCALSLRAVCRINSTNTSGFNLSTFDDRYILQYAYNWMQACNTGSNEASYEAQVRSLFDHTWHIFFKEAGIVVHNNPNGYLVMNLKKGGSYLYFDHKNKHKIIDSGITLVDNAHNVFTSSHYGSGMEYCAEKEMCHTTGVLFKQKDILPSPIHNVLLYLIQICVGWSAKLSHIVKRGLRMGLILSKSKSTYQFTRTIDLTQGYVKDTLKPLSSHIKRVKVGGMLTFIYVPSSSFTITTDVAQQISGYEYIPTPDQDTITFVRELSNGAVTTA